MKHKPGQLSILFSDGFAWTISEIANNVTIHSEDKFSGGNIVIYTSFAEFNKKKK